MDNAEMAKGLVSSLQTGGGGQPQEQVAPGEKSEKSEEQDVPIQFGKRRFGKRSKFGHYVKNKKIIDNLKKDYRLIKMLKN